MIKKIKKSLKSLIKRILKVDNLPQQAKIYSDFSDQDNTIINIVKPYTMTSPERIKVLLDAVRYVVDNDLEGDYVECGVWKGGSTLAVATLLHTLNINDRRLWLYDTFEGMSEPTDFDQDLQGRKAKDRLNNEDKNTSWVWAFSCLEEVKKTMNLTKYPDTKITYVRGKVEETLLQEKKPEKISILRLDTDWYESTKIELEILFPKVVKGGIIIIDDYGHWKGSKKAVDEYIIKNDLKLFLSRIDYTGRLIIKT